MNDVIQTTPPQVTNGVNVTQLMDTIEAIKQHPELGRFEFRVSNHWVDGTRNMANIESYFGAGQEHKRSEAFRLLADEPPVLCGRDEGANPVEYLLSALSMCVTTGIAAHAASRGIVIEAIDSKLSGDLDVRGFLGISSSVRKGYERIRVDMRIKTDASPQLLRDLAGYSPVLDVISRSVPVDITIEAY